MSKTYDSVTFFSKKNWIVLYVDGHEIHQYRKCDFLTNCFYFTFEKSDKFSSFSNKSSQDVIDISVIWLEIQKTTI